jgi:hypothetical protein
MKIHQTHGLISFLGIVYWFSGIIVIPKPSVYGTNHV